MIGLHIDVFADGRVFDAETAVANIARKGGTAIVDLLEPYG